MTRPSPAGIRLVAAVSTRTALFRLYSGWRRVPWAARVWGLHADERLRVSDVGPCRDAEGDDSDDTDEEREEHDGGIRDEEEKLPPTRPKQSSYITSPVHAWMRALGGVKGRSML